MEEHGELGIEEDERIGRIDRIDDRRARRLHDRDGVLGERIEREIGEIVGREEAAVDADPRPIERAALQERRVVLGDVLADHGAERRDHGVEQDGHVRHGPTHGPRRVLAVRDRDDPVLRDQADRGLEPDDAVVAGRADDRTVGLRADRDCTQVRGRCDARA